MDDTLHLAEIPYESGELRFRYARRLADDGSRWVRHGLFVEYAPSGQVLSEGEYVEGLEQGIWRDYYSNGQIAAEGEYVDGREEGVWRFWNGTARRKSRCGTSTEASRHEASSNSTLQPTPTRAA